MKTVVKLTGVALWLIGSLSLGSMTAAAQGPTGTPQVAYLDNQSHTVAGNSSQLYRFDYAIKDDGTRPVTTIRLVNGTRSGVNFEIWTAEQLHAMAKTAADAAADKANNTPLGRGTAPNINCDTGVLQASGSCQAPDLTWVGAFGTSGTYFVRIVNGNGYESNYQLMIQGSGVRLAPETLVASAATTTQAPAAAPPLVAEGSNAGLALPLDGQPRAVAAGKETWYRFDYAVKDNGTRPVTTIRLVNGTRSGVNFEIWTAEQLHAMAKTAADAAADKANNTPLGRGTAPNINCDTGVLQASGSCQAPDLTWVGAFGTSGTYYVRIVNGNGFESNYQLVMTTQ